jgi:hypothetical protein
VLKVKREDRVLFRKFVLVLYFLQTIFSSFPPPCYGMEDVSEDTFLIRSYLPNNDEYTTLESTINCCIKKEIPLLFPKEYEVYQQTLKVKSGFIVTAKSLEASGAFSWDDQHLFLQELDDGFFGTKTPENLSKPWKLLRYAGIAMGGVLVAVYGTSSFGIDPTRLYLAGHAIPLPVGSDAAIGLSAGMSAYHVFPHATEGGNIASQLYHRLFVNWGLPDTQGLMTENNEVHANLRSLEDKTRLTIEDIKATSSQKPHIADISWQNKYCTKVFKKEGTEFLGNVAKFCAIGFLSLMFALLYGLSFLDSEGKNAEQPVYSYWFVGAVLTFVFGTNVNEGYKAWNRSKHKALNRADPTLNHKKQALSQTLETTRKLVNLKTKSSNDFVETLYETLRKDAGLNAEATRISKFSLLFMKLSIENEVSYKEDQKILKKFFEHHNEIFQDVMQKRRKLKSQNKDVILPTLAEELQTQGIHGGKEGLEALESLASAPIDSYLQTLNMTMLKMTQRSKSGLRSFGETIGTVSTTGFAIPAFFVFQNVGEKTFHYLQFAPDVAFWGSLPIGGAASILGMMQGWLQDPEIYSGLFDPLSPSRPLYGWKWFLFPFVTASAAWSTTQYIGILSNVLESSPLLVKYFMYGLSALSAPRFFAWEYKKWDDLTRFVLTNPLITRCCNTLTQKRIEVNHDLDRAQEVISEWDAKTTTDFTHMLWDMW